MTTPAAAVPWDDGPQPADIAFSEWAKYLPPGSELRDRRNWDPSARQPCPICGHPTSDCTVHVEVERTTP